MFRASHLLLEYGRTKKRRGEDAFLLAAELRQRVLDGEPFGDLARTYSDCPSGADGGDLGPFLPGDMDRDFEEALRALEVGELSPPVQTVHGIHLIRREAP